LLQTPEIHPEVPNAAESPSAELSHSLLALIQSHSGTTSGTKSKTSAGDPIVTPTQTVFSQLDQLAAVIQEAVAAREQSASIARAHSLQMANMYNAMSQVVELLHPRFTRDPTNATSSEHRQSQILESTLQQMAIERQSSAAEHGLHVESLQVQAQLEVNRLLRVMWLGTGLAAVGVGMAFILLTN